MAMVSIGDLCDLQNGRAFKPSDWEKKEAGGVPIIRIQNLNDPQANSTTTAARLMTA